MNRSTARACEGLGFLFSLIAIILYVIATATPAFIGSDPGKNSIGPFRACFPGPALSDQETQCVPVHSDCVINVQAFDKVEGDIELKNCSQINAIRALLLVSILLGVIATLMGLFFTIKITSRVTFIIMINALAGICGMISFALTVDYYNAYVDSRINDAFLGYELEYGVILVCIAWVLQIMTIPCYLIGANESSMPAEQYIPILQPTAV